ncbi:rho GTPase-activating protein 3-like [Coffea arabica]|uniref:Rho GTPase-activating protein 3-like n=1 Tax=Coffea arabica TaxID=13443 RepID=A0A6P6WJV3_COFAR|nr:rho GTPase-activating protein 2-like [Coffea arabica]
MVAASIAPHMRMSGLFRSKSCTLPPFIPTPTAPPPSHDDSLGILRPTSPPTRSRYPHHHEDEDDEKEEEEDDDDYYQDRVEEEDGYFLVKKNHSPATTPFIGLEERRSSRRHKSCSSTSRHHHRGDPDDGQFPPGGLLAIVVAALRKSLLVTCSGLDLDTDAADDVSSSNHLDIGWPTDVRHVSHVTFDPFHGFLGLPHDLQYHLPRGNIVPSASASVFGVSAQSMQCSYDHRGNSVPTILLMMQNRLYSEGGLRAEGIFRINAENSQAENVRNLLNKGVVPCGIDVHCLAGLIKAWFRELPTGVLDSLTAEQVMHCNTEEECTQLVKLLPQTEAALLDWAINLMADIVDFEHYNKMNARNIAMVFAPNMTQMADPLTALIHAVQVMNFLKALIIKTQREREESASRITLLSSATHSPTHKDIYSSDSGVLIQCHQGLYGHCSEGSGTSELFRSGTSDHIESARADQRNFKSKSDAKQENEAVPSRISTIMRKSDDLESGLRDDGLENMEVEEGLFDKLSLRKGVRKLCRYPVLHLSKPLKKSASVGIVNTRRGGEAWA